MSDEPRQLRLQRRLLLLGGVAYLVWWLFVRLALPDAYNPLFGRVVVVLGFVAVLAASHASAAIARHLDGWLAACCCAATAHYFYLFDQNHADLNWVVGSYIMVTAVCAILQTSRSLLFYSLFAAAVSAAMLLRQSGVAFVVFLPGMITNLLFANIGLRGRLRLLARLRDSLAEQQRAEAALRLANKELEAFSYSVAHDLRAPLRAVNGFSRALVDDFGASLDAQSKDHLDRIAAAGVQMGRLIDALLDLARVTRKTARREPVDLTQQASAAARQLLAADPGRAVAFESQQGVVATGDPQLLRTVLDNLLGNAWKFTALQPSPRVTFGCTVHDDVPVYFVRDNGAGFDMAYAATLFAPFQRLHTTAEFPGTGIGLATVRRIVERHGGRVWAEGTVNEGATVYFTLQTEIARLT